MTIMLYVCLNPLMYNLCLTLVFPSFCPFSSPPTSFYPLSSYLVFRSILCGLFPLSCCPGPVHLLSPCALFLSNSFSPAVGSDLKDIQNNKHRYLIASENQRPGHFSTAPIGSLIASPSSGSLCNQGGLQSATSIQERIMSTPGGEEAIERLKVELACVDGCSEITPISREKKSPTVICPLCQDPQMWILLPFTLSPFLEPFCFAIQICS